MSIKASVGNGGVNYKSDVLIIQKKINVCVTSHSVFGSNQKALIEDGSCGKLTENAIGAFQQYVVGMIYPDKRVDPRGRTWKRLNSNITSVATVKAKTVNWLGLMSWLDSNLPQSVASEIELTFNELLKLAATQQFQTSPNASAIAYRQGDSKWGKIPLGNSSSKTIHGYGCAMVSLTMAATYMGNKTSYWPEKQTPEKLTPLIVNNILRKAGAFSTNSHMLWIVGGAKALGMKAVDSGIRKKLEINALASIDKALYSGGLALVHVDYKKTWVGDHWILVVQKTSGSTYRAIDPAYGKELTLYTKPESGQNSLSYAVLYGQSGSMGSATPENVKNYKVVRFVTLES